MSETFLVGQVARLKARCYDMAGVSVDPGGLAFKFRYGDGAVTTKLFGIDTDIVRDGVGEFHIDIPLSAAGVLHFRWESNSPNTGAAEGKIPVAAGRFS